MTEITLETLEKEKNSLLRKLEVIDMMINEYVADGTKDFRFVLDRSGNYKMVFKAMAEKRKTLDGFPLRATWLNQILYLLENRNRFMSNNELADALTDYHYGFDLHKMKRKVSVVISAAYKANRIKGLIKIGTTKSAKDVLWGFNKWLTDDEKIKDEHRPFGVNYFQSVVLE